MLTSVLRVTLQGVFHPYALARSISAGRSPEYGQWRYHGERGGPMFHFLLAFSLATGIGLADDEDHRTGFSTSNRTVDVSALGLLNPRFDLHTCRAHDPASRP